MSVAIARLLLFLQERESLVDTPNESRLGYQHALIAKRRIVVPKITPRPFIKISKKATTSPGFGFHTILQDWSRIYIPSRRKGKRLREKGRPAHKDVFGEVFTNRGIKDVEVVKVNQEVVKDNQEVVKDNQ